MDHSQRLCRIHQFNDRREMLQHIACGFGHVALLGLLGSETSAVASPGSSGSSPLAPKPYQHLPQAKRVIFLFLHGGLSHVDSFDPKPKLSEMDGEPTPVEKPKFNFASTGNLLKSPWKFHKYGQSGIEVSDLFPRVGQCIDDICVIRSMSANFVAHGGANLQLNTGNGIFVRPCMGAWLLYGLGSENENLPGFITICPSVQHGGAQNYGSAFLPAVFQGTAIGDGSSAFEDKGFDNLESMSGTSGFQRRKLDLLAQRNQRHLKQSGQDARLAARMESFELAYRMQMEAPEALDLSDETQETQQLYGIGEDPTDEFGRECLLARRFAERGVRYIQVGHSGPRHYWDQHGNLKGGHEANARKVDKPIAGLLRDLKRRGLWDDTLVICGTEFGRTPAAQGKDGRDHHPDAFTMWMAGAGLKGGYVYGATDDFGYYVTENKMHIHDFHATVLHLLGLDHTKLTYRYSGRDYRLTDVHGNVAHDIIA